MLANAGEEFRRKQIGKMLSAEIHWRKNMMLSLLFYESAHETDSKDSAPDYMRVSAPVLTYVAPPPDLMRLRPASPDLKCEAALASRRYVAPPPNVICEAPPPDFMCEVPPPI